MNLFKKKRIYLDYAAATPVRQEVFEAMKPFWNELYANPSAIHKEGVQARLAVESAREKVAKTLRVTPNDIYFVSGGTEANNLALRGSVSSMRNSGIKSEEIEIISTEVEHPSVLKTLEHLQKEGCIVTYVSVDEEGRVRSEELAELLSPRTRIVSIAYANSETGVIQDIGKLSRAVRAFERSNGIEIYFHTDASQAPLWLPCALDALGVDMMTLDAGKCEGPKGVGILVKRPKVKVVGISFGGSQEEGIRPGTEPTSLVVGAAMSIELAQKESEALSRKVTKIRNQWLKELLKIKGVIANGSFEHRLPNNVNISIPDFDSEFAVIVLDQAGIAASTKSACAGAGSGQSHVVFSMTSDAKRAAATIRFSLSPSTTSSELRKVTKILRGHLEKMSTTASFDHN